ncbi:hypothetical protein ACU4GG_27535 [Streptomyces nojiriensis]
MLTYYEVMTTDLGLLTAAADKWESMAGEIKKVEDRYGDSVQKITMGQNWTGISAGVAHTNFAATRYEYSAAQIQAKAIAGLLRDAHGQFTDLKNRLETARDKAGVPVDAPARSARRVRGPSSIRNSAYRGDPVAAQELAAVPGGATGANFSMPAVRNSKALGTFDAIASAVTRDIGKNKSQWESAVSSHLVATPPPPQPVMIQRPSPLSG